MDNLDTRGGNPGCLISEHGCFTTVPASLQVPVRVVLGAPAAVPAGAPAAHVLQAHQWLIEAIATGGCATRGLEYRRCPVCGIARYCSRTCQSLHTGGCATRRSASLCTNGSLKPLPTRPSSMSTHANAAAIPAVNNATDHSNLGGGDGGAVAAPPM